MKTHLKASLGTFVLVTIIGAYVLLSKANQRHTYRMQVNITGSASSVSVIYGVGGSVYSLTGQQLPWSKTLWADSGDIVMVVVGNEGRGGNSYTTVGLFPTGAGGVAAPIIQKANGSNSVTSWARRAP